MKLPSKVTLRFEYDDGIILEESLEVHLASPQAVRKISGTKTQDEAYGVWDDGTTTTPAEPQRAVIQKGMGKVFTLWVTAHELDHALHDLAFGLLLRRR